jgi:integrase
LKTVSRIQAGAPKAAKEAVVMRKVLALAALALGVDEIGIEHIKQAIAPLWDRDDHKARAGRSAASRLFSSAASRTAGVSAANIAEQRTFRHIAPKRPKSDDDNHHPMGSWQEAPEMIDRLRRINHALSRICSADRRQNRRGRERARCRQGDVVDPEGQDEMREPHVVALSKQALALLAEQDEVRTGEFVFPSRFDGESVSPDQCWRVSNESTEGAGSPHRWRASFRSCCGANGTGREVAERALA